MHDLTMTKAELAAWQELARAARRLRDAQRKAETSRRRVHKPATRRKGRADA
jgi:hypothetical protein